jgi:hypothetical protein
MPKPVVRFVIVLVKQFRTEPRASGPKAVIHPASEIVLVPTARALPFKVAKFRQALGSCVTHWVASLLVKQLTMSLPLVKILMTDVTRQVLRPSREETLPRAKLQVAMGVRRLRPLKLDKARHAEGKVLAPPHPIGWVVATATQLVDTALVVDVGVTVVGTRVTIGTETTTVPR